MTDEPLRVELFTSPPERTFKRGDRVRKVRGSSWQGRVVGDYSTDLTPEGYCVESERELGSVQIYPVGALELTTDEPASNRIDHLERVATAARALFLDVNERGAITIQYEVMRALHDALQALPPGRTE